MGVWQCLEKRRHQEPKALYPALASELHKDQPRGRHTAQPQSTMPMVQWPVLTITMVISDSTPGPLGFCALVLECRWTEGWKEGREKGEGQRVTYIWEPVTNAQEIQAWLSPAMRRTYMCPSCGPQRASEPAGTETPTAALRIVSGVCWTQFSLNELSTWFRYISSLATEPRSLLVRQTAACRPSAFPGSYQP